MRPASGYGRQPGPAAPGSGQNGNRAATEDPTDRADSAAPQSAAGAMPSGRHRRECCPRAASRSLANRTNLLIDWRYDLLVSRNHIHHPAELLLGEVTALHIKTVEHRGMRRIPERGHG